MTQLLGNRESWYESDYTDKHQIVASLVCCVLLPPFEATEFIPKMWCTIAVDETKIVRCYSMCDQNVSRRMPLVNRHTFIKARWWSPNVHSDTYTMVLFVNIWKMKWFKNWVNRTVFGSFPSVSLEPFQIIKWHRRMRGELKLAWTSSTTTKRHLLFQKLKGQQHLERFFPFSVLFPANFLS